MVDKPLLWAWRIVSTSGSKVFGEAVALVEIWFYIGLVLKNHFAHLVWKGEAAQLSLECIQDIAEKSAMTTKKEEKNIL